MFMFYLFLVSSIGLLTFYIPAMVGIGGLAEVCGGAGYAWQLEQAVSTLSLAAVGAAIWLVHWRLFAGKRDKRDADDHGLIYFHLFFTSSILALGLFAHGKNALNSAANLALGIGQGQGWALAAAAINLAITAALWLYHLRAFRQEAEIARTTTKRKN